MGEKESFPSDETLIGSAGHSPAQLAEAEQLHRTTLQIRTKVLGENNPDTIFSLNNLATALLDERKFDEAERLFAAALEKEVVVPGENHPEIANVYYNIAMAQAGEGNRSETLTSLHHAPDHGYADEEIPADKAFVPMQADSDFKAIVAEIRNRLAVSQKQN
jgi:hypothetical protein